MITNSRNLDLDLLDDSSSETYVAQYASEKFNGASPPSIPPQANKDDRKAELERRREERRQVKKNNHFKMSTFNLTFYF